MGGPATLVIHPGALGDVLQSVPALRALRLAGRLVLAAQPRMGRLAHELGLVDAAISFDGLGLGALFTREPPPAALAERLGAYARVVSWFGARDPVYPAALRAVARDCVVARPVPEAPEPVWRHLLGTIDASGAAARDPARVPDPWRIAARETLRGLGIRPGRPVFVVHAGAGAAWKRWPAEAFADVVARVVRETRAQPLLHQGPADRETVARLAVALQEVPCLVEPDLPLLAGVLAEASAYLGGDSGVSHLAAAVGMAAVIVYPGSTRERWTPWSPTAAALPMCAGSAATEGVAAELIARLRGAIA